MEAEVEKLVCQKQELYQEIRHFTNMCTQFETRFGNNKFNEELVISSLNLLIVTIRDNLMVSENCTFSFSVTELLKKAKSYIVGDSHEQIEFLKIIFSILKQQFLILEIPFIGSISCKGRNVIIQVEPEKIVLYDKVFSQT